MSFLSATAFPAQVLGAFSIHSWLSPSHLANVDGHGGKESFHARSVNFNDGADLHFEHLRLRPAFEQVLGQIGKLRFQLVVEALEDGRVIRYRGLPNSGRLSVYLFEDALSTLPEH